MNETIPPEQPVPAPPDEPAAAPPARRPALVINIYSWATPIVGLVSLVAGVLLGVYGPALLRVNTPLAAAVTPTPGASVESASPSSAAQVDTSSVQDADSLMQFLISQAYHFRGDPSAAVTIIDFSDFQ